ncbi:MAG: hypothetical protein KKC46_11785 [Proteobacteria bacterium]|nr:hypothetical protein [Pseudomonadota bacterium]
MLSAKGILMKPVLKPHTKASLSEKLFGIFSMHKKIQDDLSKEGDKQNILYSYDKDFDKFRIVRKEP